jgi:hypothetical protein
MILLDSKPNLFKLRLASSKKIFFFIYDESEGARIYVTVNKHKMYLDKMFYNLKWNFRINLGFEYVLFYGKDYNSANL